MLIDSLHTDNQGESDGLFYSVQNNVTAVWVKYHELVYSEYICEAEY